MRAFVCGQCGYFSLRSHHVVVHLRTHTGERPFPCGHCNRAFTTNGNLRKHVAVVHGLID
jgi:KRAB domain-containing zinc finger protein